MRPETTKVPGWYFTATSIPVVVCVVVAAFVSDARAAFDDDFDVLGLVFSAYAALVLLGYLLFALCRRTSAQPTDRDVSDPRPRRE